MYTVMNAMMNTTMKATFISALLHTIILFAGSLALNEVPLQTLELNGGSGRNLINLSSINFISKKSSATSKSAIIKKAAQREQNYIQTVTTRAGAVAAASSPSVSSSSSDGAKLATGGHDSGADFDQGKLFGQIKNFFEVRLGSTLNINVEQLIKIKVSLGSDGEILSADIVQGKLDFQSLKKVLAAAKNIPLKSFWKSSSPMPQELVIPLLLSPG